MSVFCDYIKSIEQLDFFLKVELLSVSQGERTPEGKREEKEEQRRLLSTDR